MYPCGACNPAACYTINLDKVLNLVKVHLTTVHSETPMRVSNNPMIQSKKQSKQSKMTMSFFKNLVLYY